MEGIEGDREPRIVEPVGKAERPPKGPRRRVPPPPNLQLENPLPPAEVQSEVEESFENPTGELPSEIQEIYRIKGNRIIKEDIGKVPGSEFDETL